jgi:D-alanyl-D-alanine carboxypeptidase
MTTSIKIGVLYFVSLFFLGFNTRHEIHRKVNILSPMKEQEASIQSYLMGKFDPSNHPDFVKISIKHADRPGLYLRKEVYEAYKRMYETAKLDGIDLKILSATRNFEYQKRIWESKWLKICPANPSYQDKLKTAKRILKYSAMPGSSRHHWGTDIDMCSVENAFFKGSKGAKVFAWLKKNAHIYGFCQTYTPKGEERPSGYNEEKWHWSYQPSSLAFTKEIMASIADSMFSGFSGAETAGDLKIVENYMLGLNPECKQ